MTRILSRALALLVFAGLLAAAPQAVAQVTTPPPAAEQQATPEFTDAELDAFVDAYIGIEALQERFQNEHGDVVEPEQMEALQQQFQLEAFQIMADSGVSPERYEAIVMATQTSPELGMRLVERIEAARGGA